jgi:hypothetical protein
MGYTTENWGSIPDKRSLHIDSGALPASWEEVKQPGREADYSPNSSADVSNAWSYTLFRP